MSILEALFKQIDIYSSKDARILFYQRFIDGPNAAQLQKPMIEKKGRWQTIKNFNDIKQSKTSGLIVENKSDDFLEIIFFENIINKINTIEQAFDAFIDISSHSNALGDFRKNINYYSNVLRGNRYLFFHGCGNCVLLGVLLQALIKYVLGYKIDLFYSCGKFREFMHVYGRYFTEGRCRYIDADQKVICDNDAVNENYSPSLIYQLLSGAGYFLYKELCDKGKKYLFYPMTHELLSEYSITPGAFIYQPDPHQHNFSKLFENARSYEETLDLFSNDYAWKPAFREKGNNGEMFLMSEWRLDSKLILPKGAAFTIGLDVPSAYELPVIVNKFSQIFFGRVPGQLILQLEKNIPFSVALPEIPWMLICESYTGIIYINNIKFNLRSEDNNKFGILGMGDLVILYDDINKLKNFEVISPINVVFKIVFPINGLAYNAEMFKLKLESNQDHKVLVRG